MKVLFLKDTKSAVVSENPPDTILVYYEGYSLPDLKNVEYMTFNKFKTVYSVIHFNKLIIVGLNRIITPSNRCDMVNDFLQTMTRNIPKVSIDTSPFIGEPWRLWYHYDVTNSGKFNIPHGYAIETEWKHWFYRDVNHCRLSGDNINSFVTDTYSDLDPLRTVIEFDSVSNQDLEHYEQLKEHVINSNNTPKLMIAGILREANKRYQIDIGVDFFKSNSKIVLPDLGIYRFVAEEINRRKDIYNAIIKNKHLQ